MTLADSTESNLARSNSAAFFSYRWIKSKANQAPTPAARSRIKSVTKKNVLRKNGRRRFGLLIFTSRKAQLGANPFHGLPSGSNGKFRSSVLAGSRGLG